MSFVSDDKGALPALAFSGGIMATPHLSAFLGREVVDVKAVGKSFMPSAVVGWGAKPNTQKAREFARSRGVDYWGLEDGFLRSFSTGDKSAPLSMVIDRRGIYYDSTKPSSLEVLLESGKDFFGVSEKDAHIAMRMIVANGLSKYNNAPALDQVERALGRPLLREGDKKRVLVVDQTAGDMSLKLGGATEETFAQMLQAALAEHPQATIYVKTHPEVVSGRKGGHFAGALDSGRVVYLRQLIEPMSLINRMDHVYVATSTMGFEALMAGKPVTCFGMPWYAGWGQTDDRQSCYRRTRHRDVVELFAAAYMWYSVYVDPETGKRASIFNVIDALARQRRIAGLGEGLPPVGRLVAIGGSFRLWKQFNLRPILEGFGREVIFAKSPQEALALGLNPLDSLVVWGATPSPGVQELAHYHGCRIFRMEDGFVRSVGLGSDLIPPRSLVLDKTGIYFDPSRPSDLETLLLTGKWSAFELDEARQVREFVVANGLTKYNTEERRRASWHFAGRRVILVPGQVEDDASIRLGCTKVKTNLDLLKAARSADPKAFIVYKPHPDVLSGNRKGAVSEEDAYRYADHVETGLSVVSCLDACDEVHTMTSLTGFDALLRGKKVVVYGQPFYAGWGLTEDKVTLEEGVALSRRFGRKLTLDQLVAGVMIDYPVYWDPQMRAMTTCKTVLRQVLEQRTALERTGELHTLGGGFVSRQIRKGKILAKAWLSMGAPVAGWRLRHV